MRRVGVALAVVGGLLIMLEGAVYSSYGFGELSAIAILSGAAIIALAVAAEMRTRFRQLFGAVILVLALASWFGLSGYLLGTFLGSLGGTLIVLTPGFATTFHRGAPAITGADLGPLCPSCGRHIPTWTSTCPYCGTAG